MFFSCPPFHRCFISEPLRLSAVLQPTRPVASSHSDPPHPPAPLLWLPQSIMGRGCQLGETVQPSPPPPPTAAALPTPPCLPAHSHFPPSDSPLTSAHSLIEHHPFFFLQQFIPSFWQLSRMNVCRSLSVYHVIRGAVTPGPKRPFFITARPTGGGHFGPASNGSSAAGLICCLRDASGSALFK